MGLSTSKAPPHQSPPRPQTTPSMDPPLGRPLLAGPASTRPAASASPLMGRGRPMGAWGGAGPRRRAGGSARPGVSPAAETAAGACPGAAWGCARRADCEEEASEAGAGSAAGRMA